jgi:hypothetical protein
MRTTRSRTALAGAIALTLCVACLDIKHTNPFDPDTPLRVTIMPETLFSVAGEVHFTFSTVPEITDPGPAWGGGNADLSPLGYAGSFFSHAAPLWPQTETVQVSIGVGRNNLLNLPHYSYARVFNGSVVVTQRLVQLHARCPDTNICDTLSAGASWSVFMDGFDALGSGIAGLVTPTMNPPDVPAIAQFIVRDTSIASASPIGMRAASVTAKRSGSTWLIAQRDSLRDSLQLVVR